MDKTTLICLLFCKLIIDYFELQLSVALYEMTRRENS